jgi:hypothetical protein
MKFTCPTLILSVLIGVAPFSAFAQYEPPTESELDKMLANPDLVFSTVRGANVEEAAGLIERISDRLAKSKLNESQKKYNIAFFVARTTIILGNERIEFAQRLLEIIAPEIRITVLAGLSVGGRGSADFMETLRGWVVASDEQLEAVNKPPVPLTVPVYNQLVQALGLSLTLPPAVTDSLPPPIPVGTGTPTPAPTSTPTPVPTPPVAGPYPDLQ